MDIHRHLNHLSWDVDFALEQVGGEREFLLRALEYFLDAAREDVKGIGEGIERGEPQKIRQRAHSLKGASLNIGMKRIYEISRELEKATDSKKINELKEFYKELVGLLKEVRGLLEAEEGLFT